MVDFAVALCYNHKRMKKGKLTMKYYLVFIGVMSLLAFVAYFADKKKAKKGAWRISEKVLLCMGFLGGSVGALAAMQMFRHKTRHYYFYIVNILGLIWQVGALFIIAVYL